MPTDVIARKRLPGQPLAVDVRRDRVEVQTTARAYADSRVGVASDVVAEFRVDVDAREDDAQRGVGPREMIFVKPKVTEAAEFFLALRHGDAGLHCERAPVFDVHLSEYVGGKQTHTGDGEQGFHGR